MNFKIDLTTKQQNLLQQLDFQVENKDYSKDEISHCIDIVTSHIMSKSSKNGDLSKEQNKYNELINILISNEK